MEEGLSRKRVLVLLSGGMDSVTALYDAHLRHDVVLTVSFDYGSKHNLREIPFAAYHAENLGVPTLKLICVSWRIISSRIC
jgi:7-cyano-7-deazaguanine synthase